MLSNENLGQIVVTVKSDGILFELNRILFEQWLQKKKD